MEPLPDAVRRLILHREGASLHDLDVALMTLLERILHLPSEIRWPDDFQGPSRHAEFREQIGQVWPELGFYDDRTGDVWSPDTDEVGDAIDDLADIAVDLDRVLQFPPTDVPGALSYLRFQAVVHWGDHVRGLVRHLRFQLTRPPSVRQLHELLEAALPGGVLDRGGAARLLAFLDRVPPPLLPRVDEQWRQTFRVNGYDAPGPAGWHRVGPWQWRSNLPAWLGKHPDDLLAAPGVVAALASSADGYAREAAVRLLARIDLPLATGVLLVRAADWVEPVRVTALQALHTRLSERYAAHWARYAALVDRLEQVERGDAAPVREARALLRTPAGLQAIREVLPGADRDTRPSLLRVAEELPEPLRTPWLGTFAGDPHPLVRRRVAHLAPVDQLPGLLADPDAGVREVALRRLIDTPPEDALPAFPLVALLDPRAGVRALAQFEARRRGVNLGAAYLDVNEHSLPGVAVRGWAAGVRELGLADAGPRLEALLEHANARVRVEALRALGDLAPGRHVGLLENALLGSGAQARVGEAALRGANLLTVDRLRALWSRATTVQQRRRLIRAAAGLPRFDGAVLLLGWRAAASTEVQAGLDDQVRKLLTGFGVRYSTRPSPAQRAALGQARLASPLDERVEQLLRTVLT